MRSAFHRWLLAAGRTYATAWDSSPGHRKWFRNLKPEATSATSTLAWDNVLGAFEFGHGMPLSVRETDAASGGKPGVARSRALAIRGTSIGRQTCYARCPNHEHCPQALQSPCISQRKHKTKASGQMRVCVEGGEYSLHHAKRPYKARCRLQYWGFVQGLRL